MPSSMVEPLAVRWGRRLQPAWSRDRLFEPALHDLLSDGGVGRVALSARTFLLWLQCWQVAVVEIWRLWAGRTSLARRRLGFVGRSPGAGPGPSRGTPGDSRHPIEPLIQDVRFAVRALRARPGFTLAVVGVLALGIGANTVVFTVLDKVVLRPLDFANPDRLVFLTETSRIDGVDVIANTTAGGFATWREQSELIDSMSAVLNATFNLTADDRTVQLQGLWVSSSFFDVLGQPPGVGPGFTPLADRTEAEVVISHGLWQNRFAGAPSAIGAELQFDEQPYRVVGVADEGFTFGSDVDLWAVADNDIPLPPVEPDGDYTQDFGLGYLGVIGRLAPDVSFEQAVAEMTAISEAISAEHPEAQGNRGVSVRPLHEYAVGEVRAPLAGLVAAVAFVLLIACANIASLLLVRAGARRRELAIREAMGASRRRLFRLLVVESLTLSFLGGMAGVVLAAVGAEFIVNVLPELPRTIDLAPDLRILGFSLLVTAACGLLFGTAPAWAAARADVRSALGSTRTSESGGARRARNALVVAEIAIALVLVLGAGLMLKSFARLVQAEPGFDPEGIVAVGVTLPSTRYTDNASIAGFFAGALEKVRSHPDVVAAATTLAAPFTGSAARMDVFAEDEQPDESKDQRAVFHIVSPGYFETMEIPLLRGRTFEAADNADAPFVAIVSEEFVRRRLPPGSDPLEASVHFGDFEPVPIVGVVGSVLHYGYGGEPYPELYAPRQQVPWRFGTFMLRGRGPEADLSRVVADAVASVDGLQPTGSPRPMSEVLYGSVQQPRFVTALLGTFAASALLLAGIGIFGLISFSVGQRNQEIGVRMALGASGPVVLRMILRQVVVLLAFGGALGIAAGAGLSQLLTSQLHGVEPTDPVVYGLGIGVLSIAALGAAWLPAWRATRIDPVRALRQD